MPDHRYHDGSLSHNALHHHLLCHRLRLSLLRIEEAIAADRQYRTPGPRLLLRLELQAARETVGELEREQS